MNKRSIIKEIKLLKEVKPDPAFVERARNLVLTAKPHLRLVPSWATGVALVAVILILIGSGILFSSGNPSISSSLKKDSLVEEFNKMDINLQIDEITYSQDIHKTIASALTEISDSKANHMNPSILEAEKKYIDDLSQNGNEEEINNLLNRVIN